MCKARVRLATVQSRNERKTVRNDVVVRSIRKFRRASKPSVAFVQVAEACFVDVVFAESSVGFPKWPAGSLEFNSRRIYACRRNMLPGNNLRRTSKNSRGLVSGLKRVWLPQLLCLVRKLTTVGYSKKPTFSKQARRRLFSYFSAISGARPLSRDSFSGRDSRQNSPSLGASQRQILSESLGYENRRVNDSGL